MPRGLDHIVHAVANLDAAADFYRRCGFLVGARNRHPWGTHNHIVQLPGFFIEVLTVGEPNKLGDDGLSRHFGAFQQDAIARGDGLSMLLVESRDIAADAEDFARGGIGTSQPLPFERQATLPNGKAATVGFSLAFARDPNAPQAGFAACMQHNPDAFWNPAFQKHPNGVTGLAGVVIVARHPDRHADFLKAWTGVADIDTRTDGFLLRTPRGDVEVLNPEAFATRTGHAPEGGEGAVIAALRLAVVSLDVLEGVLREGDVPLRRLGATLCVPPQAAFGATLIFEQPHIA